MEVFKMSKSDKNHNHSHQDQSKKILKLLFSPTLFSP